MLTGAGGVALSDVLDALSYALDLTEGEPPGHAVRTTAIGMRLAEEIGLPEEQRSGLFYALLLKDAGCSSNAARLDRIADAFARVIDAKSPFTARHSSEVARWAVAIGAQLDLTRGS